MLEPINNLTTEFDFYDIQITKEVGTLPDTYLYTPAGHGAVHGQLPLQRRRRRCRTDGTQCPGAHCGYVDALNQNLGSREHRRRGHRPRLQGRTPVALGRFNFDLQSTWVHSYKYQN